MPILNYVKCPSCGKKVFYEYVPGATFKDSYWVCRICGHKLEKVDHVKEDMII